MKFIGSFFCYGSRCFIVHIIFGLGTKYIFDFFSSYIVRRKMNTVQNKPKQDFYVFTQKISDFYRSIAFVMLQSLTNISIFWTLTWIVSKSRYDVCIMGSANESEGISMNNPPALLEKAKKYTTYPSSFFVAYFFLSNASQSSTRNFGTIFVNNKKPHCNEQIEDGEGFLISATHFVSFIPHRPSCVCRGSFILNCCFKKQLFETIQHT